MYLKNKWAKFMEGRNGVDAICYASVGLYFVITFINAFFRLSILNTAMTMIAVYIAFRMMSKNVARRQAENRKFLLFVDQAKGHWRQFILRIKEIKTHRYRRCPECHIMLRLPRKVGSHKVVCPRCKKKVAVKILI